MRYYLFIFVLYVFEQPCLKLTLSSHDNSEVELDEDDISGVSTLEHIKNH